MTMNTGKMLGVRDKSNILSDDKLVIDLLALITRTDEGLSHTSERVSEYIPRQQ
jgi:hypothetical protein